MRRRRSPVVLAALAALLLACGQVGAHTRALPAPVAKALAAAGIPEAAVGVVVQELDARQPSVSVNAGQPMHPASTMKLVTTLAALELLGPAFTWRTEALAAGEVRGDLLDGDLVLRGGGDPRLTIENFWTLLRHLRQRGVREIRGDLVLDRGAFAIEAREAGVLDGDPHRAYNTPPDALLVNFRALMLHFVPDPVARTVGVLLDPPLPQVRLSSKLAFEAGGQCDAWLARIGIQVQATASAATIHVGGSFPGDCGERQRPVSVLSHGQYLLGLFQTLWRDLGGVFGGSVRDAATPPGARALASLRSASLSEVVRDINKWSNNVMAQQLYLTLGMREPGAPATWARSERAVQQWLRQRQLSMPELVLENGSGLSRVERISARSMADLLIAAYAGPTMPEFIASLPLAAVDGTMRKRLPGTPVAGHAHIKTGSLNEVRTVAGYVLDARGRRSAVVFFVNHPRAQAAQPAIDALLLWVHQPRRGE
jgi:D-alanyl-D-alanine carboxypeptidase/D-alanyl-D-alanine-endopeptidase (penicillin-binding protein 4)